MQESALEPLVSPRDWFPNYLLAACLCGTAYMSCPGFAEITAANKAIFVAIVLIAAVSQETLRMRINSAHKAQLAKFEASKSAPAMPKKFELKLRTEV